MRVRLWAVASSLAASLSAPWLGSAAAQSHGAWLEIDFSRAPDWITAIFTLALAIGTVVLAISTHRLWRAAEGQIAAANRAADVARDTLVAAQRPWVKVSSARVTSPLLFDDQEGRVDLALVLKNVGKSPALRISLDVSLVETNRGFSQSDFAKSIVESRRRIATDPLALKPDITLFPDDVLEVRTTAWMNNGPLSNSREWAGKHPGAIVIPAVIGCVVYEFPFEEGFHQTGIIYVLQKLRPYPLGQSQPKYSTVPKDYPAISDLEGAIHLEGAVSPTELTLRPHLVGSGRVD